MTKKERFGALLVSLARDIARLERERVCCGELTFQQFETLRRLERNQGAAVKSIAGELSIDESTASRNVSILQRDGYLSKKKGERDGRSVRIVLTAKGRAAVSGLRCEEQEILAAVFERVPFADRLTVLRVLETLRSAIADEATPCCDPHPVVKRLTPGS